jgi:hypothetical protein
VSVCLCVCLFVRSFAAAGRFEEKEDRSVCVGDGALTNDPQARHGLCQAMYLRRREAASGTPAANDQLTDRGGSAGVQPHFAARGLGAAGLPSIALGAWWWWWWW